jgi:hypothetical protein
LIVNNATHPSGIANSRRYDRPEGSSIPSRTGSNEYRIIFNATGFFTRKRGNWGRVCVIEPDEVFPRSALREKSISKISDLPRSSPNAFVFPGCLIFPTTVWSLPAYIGEARPPANANLAKKARTGAFTLLPRGMSIA